MSLFRRRDNSKIEFDVVGVRDTEFKKIEEIVKRNGGKIKHDDKQQVKFTHRYEYVTEAYHSATLYSVQFIKDCVAQNKILSPHPYRIGPPKMYDHIIMSHFLYGSFKCCTHSSKNVTQQNDRRKSNKRGTERPAEDLTDSQPECDITYSSNVGQSTSASNSRINCSNEAPSASQSNRQPTNEYPNDFHRWVRKLVRDMRRRRIERRGRIHCEASIMGRSRGRNITRNEEKQILLWIYNNRIHPNDLHCLRVWKGMINAIDLENRTPSTLYKHWHYIMSPGLEDTESLRLFHGDGRRHPFRH